MKKSLLSTLVAGALAAGLAIPASADILTLSYDSYGGFIDGTQVNIPFPVLHNFRDDRDPYNGPEGIKHLAGQDHINFAQDSGGDGAPDAWRELHWGTGAHSGVLLTGVENGTLITHGEQAVFGSLTHYNNVIDQFFDGSSNLSWNLDIYSDATQTVNLYHGHWEYKLIIWETENNPASGTCAHVDVVGNGKPCADAFSYELLSGPMTDTFMAGEDEYRLDITGFWNSATDGSLEQYFVSGEGFDNTGFVKISAVPEPASLALMGLGLVGLGVARRRKQVQKA